MPSRYTPRSRSGGRKKSPDQDMRVTGKTLKQDEGSRVVRCSYKVYRLIGNAILTEKVIREALGNNPDTSKALRLLLRKKMIQRLGGGGRTNPFHYQQSKECFKDDINAFEAEEAEHEEVEEEDHRGDDEMESSAELSDVVQQPPKAKKRSPKNNNNKADNKANISLVMERVQCDENGIEPHEVLSNISLKKTVAAAAVAVAAGAAAASVKVEAPEQEIPVPGWRMVGD